ncbi:RCC1 and BTB domain-containing protein 1, partial [Cyphomyrmex costatus]
KVYHWGNIRQFNNIVEYYSQLFDLRHTRIVQAAVSKQTFIILTVDDRMFYFQTLDNNGTWMRQIDSQFSEKVRSICCGDSFFALLTDDGRVYTWGANSYGQLGISTYDNNFIDKPRQVKISNEEIVQITCGYTHTLALTAQGYIYGWGHNLFGELDSTFLEINPSPRRVQVTKKDLKILDVAAMKNVSCAITEEKHIVSVWGNCCEQKICKPAPCDHTTLFDMCNALTGKPPTTVKNNLYRDQRLKLLNDIAKSFNEISHSDLAIQVTRRYIYVHKIILQCRNSYFKDIDQFIQLEGDQNVIILNQFSYEMYYAYFKYLYTGKIEVSTVEEKFKLFNLAEAFSDERFKKSLCNAIKDDTTTENLFSTYIYTMLKYNEELEQFCFDFFKEYKTEMIKMKSFMDLNEEIKKKFLKKSK